MLARAAVVVGHGGFGTTQGALVAGVPQVALPLFSFDQYANAERVAAVGVGVALVGDAPGTRPAADLVPYGPAETDGLAAAVRRLLEDDRYGTAAQALAAEVAALPDARIAVEQLRRPQSGSSSSAQACTTAGSRVTA